MTAPDRSLSRHHASRTATDDDDLLALGRRHNLPVTIAASKLRVNGTRHVVAAARRTRMATQAGAHRLGLATIRLLENLGVGQQGTRDITRIGSPTRDDVLGLVNVGDAADDRDGNGDFLAFLDLA